MSDDLRCCGSNACIVDDSGRCWCGQQWDGEKMCHVPLAPMASKDKAAAEADAAATETTD